MELVTSHN